MKKNFWYIFVFFVSSSVSAASAEHVVDQYFHGLKDLKIILSEYSHHEVSTIHSPRFGATLLHYAVEKLAVDDVKSLLETEDALLKWTDKEGNTPLHYLVSVRKFYQEKNIEISENDERLVQIAELLLTKNPALLEQRNNKERTPLHLLIFSEGGIPLLRYFLRLNVDVNAIDVRKRSVLHYLCYIKNKNYFTVLKKNKVKMTTENIKDEEGMVAEDYLLPCNTKMLAAYLSLIE